MLLLAGCKNGDADNFQPTKTSRVPASLWNLPGEPPYLVAHYLPWFSTQTWNHWKWEGGGTKHDPRTPGSDGRRDIAAVHYPLIGPYDSTDPAVIRYHLETMKAAGIDALAALWYGPGSETDRPIPLLLEEAARQGLRVTICYEEKINFPPYRQPASRGQLLDNVVGDLTYLLERYGTHPVFLRREGVPVLFQFNSIGMLRLGPRYLTAGEWKTVLARVPPVVYGRQNVDPTYHPLLPWAYQWWTPENGVVEKFHADAAALRDAGRLMFFMSMICPGFDDSGVSGWGTAARITPRNGGRTLNETMGRALAGSPELVQIVTWNDFNEGTEIEPSEQEGFAALDAIETWWAAVKSRRANLDDNRAPLQRYREMRTSNP